MSNVINTGIVACILALLLYISNVHIPYIIAQPIKMLGAITGPVSMLLIGSFLLDIEWKSVFKDVKVWIFTFFKMVIIPLVIILIMLGLSIVRAVAIMHRGDAFARSEGGINTFGLTFAMQANKTADNSPSDTESGADKIVREASA